jgi:1,4-alpha-glucan branching enzyme
MSLFAIHEWFGDPDSLKAFIDAAHERHLAVVMDWVPNHFVRGNILLHWDSLYDHGCYFYKDMTKLSTHYGPRPDFSSQGVREYLRDSLYMWLIDFKFDGVRVDSTGTMRIDSKGETIVEAWSLLQELTTLVRRWDKKKLLIAEDLKKSQQIHSLAGFDTQWDDSLFHALKEIGSQHGDHQRDIVLLASAITTPSYIFDPFTRIIFLENHDTVPQDREKRTPVWIASKHCENNLYALKRSTLLTSVILTVPGVPMLLQAQEIYETGSANWPHPPNIDWERKLKYEGIFKFYANLIALRRNKEKTTAGLLGRHIQVTHQNNINKVISWHRFSKAGPTDDVIVIANFSNVVFQKYTIGVPRPGDWVVRFDSDSKEYSNVFDGMVQPRSYQTSTHKYDNQLFSITVVLPRYGLLILSQDL